MTTRKMKFMIAAFVYFCCVQVAKAQGESPDSLYIVTYTVGPAWDPAKAPTDQQYFRDHSANLSSMRKSGTIKFGARYDEKGIIVISAKSFQDAKRLIKEDPAVHHSMFNADVQKLNVFYDGCVGK